MSIVHTFETKAVLAVEPFLFLGPSCTSEASSCAILVDSLQDPVPRHEHGLFGSQVPRGHDGTALRR